MNNVCRELFKKALRRAMSEKYESELSENRESDACSRGHYDKMRAITGAYAPHRKKKLTRIGLIAIIAAAAILLAACTAAYVYRESVGNLIKEIYEEYIKVGYDGNGGYPTGDLEPYELTYVPVGYERTKDIITRINAHYKYTNDAGDNFTFHQNFVDGVSLGVDGDEGYDLAFVRGDKTVYCRVLDTTCHYIWSDGVYMFSIDANKLFEENELWAIIDGMVLRNQG
jgi:hypothetical protein